MIKPSKSEHISKELDQFQKEMVNIDKTLKESLSVLDVTELDYLKESPDYL